MRQLKICATCFDISVGLLRVLEMVTDVAGAIFLDGKNPSAELLLSRLYQVGLYISLIVYIAVSVRTSQI